MPTLDMTAVTLQEQSTDNKLANLRLLMKSNQIDSYLIPAIDEHLNLSVPVEKQRRAWLTGFTGSAGDLLVTLNRAYLYVDFRYYEQAELQVDQSLIEVVKLEKPGHLNLIETLEKLAKEAHNNYALGFDPFTLSIEQFNKFLDTVIKHGVQLVPIPENLVDNIWLNKSSSPKINQPKLIYLPPQITGATTGEKLAKIRKKMAEQEINILPLTNLNQIAWLFNLRGDDIPFIPLFIAYAIITAKDAFLFTDLQRITPEIQENLGNSVTFLNYGQYPEVLTELLTNFHGISRVLLDPKHTTTGTYQIVLGVPEEVVKVVMAPNPIEPIKAHKNPVEIEQMQLANLQASRGKTRTFKWLDDQIQSGKLVTEFDVKETIESFYKEEPNFHSLSFRTIAGAGANSSIVHYGTPSPEVQLKLGEFLLLDSGSQYLGGTTDDTRTVIIGEPNELQIAHYTTVLIAHINCARQRFPKGTTGVQLDAITRAALWQEGLDYGHGTGHGVGAFLNVHEGPNGISKLVTYPLEPGMITSIEPGYYQSGWGGIRIENLYVVRQLFKDENDVEWYGFEPLTFIPFDRRLIDVKRLSFAQRQWLENYLQKVVEKLTPTLPISDAEWLQQVCNLS